MLLIFASLGDIERGFELTIERVIFTVLGIAAAVLTALLLRRWESRREPSPGQDCKTMTVGQPVSPKRREFHVV